MIAHWCESSKHRYLASQELYIGRDSIWIKLDFLITCLLTSLTDKSKAKSTLCACLASDIVVRYQLRRCSSSSWNLFTAVSQAFCLGENADLTILLCTHSTSLLAWSDGSIGPRNRTLHGYFLTDLVNNILVNGLLVNELFQSWLFCGPLSTRPCWKGL